MQTDDTDRCQVVWKCWENLQNDVDKKDRMHKDCVLNTSDTLSPVEPHQSCSVQSQTQLTQCSK